MMLCGVDKKTKQNLSEQKAQPCSPNKARLVLVWGQKKLKLKKKSSKKN